MDNACCLKATTLSTVRLEFLPFNCTGSLQPADTGINNSFKVYACDIKWEELYTASIMTIRDSVFPDRCSLFNKTCKGTKFHQKVSASVGHTLDLLKVSTMISRKLIQFKTCDGKSSSNHKMGPSDCRRISGSGCWRSNVLRNEYTGNCATDEK